MLSLDTGRNTAIGLLNGQPALADGDSHYDGDVDRALFTGHDLGGPQSGFRPARQTRVLDGDDCPGCLELSPARALAAAFHGPVRTIAVPQLVRPDRRQSSIVDV